MPDLLLELGCEELPATFVRKAYEDLAAAVAQRLKDAEIPFEPGHPTIGTPRRLIVHFTNVADRQPDRTKEMRGPSVQAAYDAEGKPTKALEGFCRGNGVDPSAARKDGDYVWVTKAIPGRPTPEILAEILPEAIRSLSFEKSMRWGAARMRFARPIRWILASFGGVAVPFEIEGVASGLQSRGHRFDHPEAFEAKTYDELVDGLIARKVEPDPAERRKRIHEGTVIIATGEPEIVPDLLEENVFLTEWPTPIEGQFKEEYLELPEPVLVTAMAKHEKMFPIRGRDGKLINRFVFVRNSGEDAAVRLGTEWVLNARFNDAKFFFEEDKKRTLAEFLEKTQGILFQEKLGTVRARADRLATLAAELAKQTGADEQEAELARQAGLYAKADLATGLVSELASLQGIVGGEYGKRDGLPESVCQGMAGQYDLGKNLAGGKVKDSAGARTAVRLLAADQFDKLVGYLGIGLAPSGSSDPFGLRRAANFLVETAWAWNGVFPRLDGEMLDAALTAYASQGHLFEREEVRRAMQTVFEVRYEALLEDERPDLVEAVKASALDPQGLRFQLSVLTELAGDREFVQTATRPINILAAALEKGQFDPSASGSTWEESLDSADGTALHAAAKTASIVLSNPDSARDKETVVTLLKELAAPINRFFESTMIMAEDPKVRAARLELVALVASVLKTGGDWSKVVFEG